MTTTNDTTFDISVAFLLLGTDSAPKQVCTPHPRSSQPLELVKSVLEILCEGVRIQVSWDGQGGENRDEEAWIVSFDDNREDDDEVLSRQERRALDRPTGAVASTEDPGPIWHLPLSLSRQGIPLTSSHGGRHDRERALKEVDMLCTALSKGLCRDGEVPVEVADIEDTLGSPTSKKRRAKKKKEMQKEMKGKTVYWGLRAVCTQRCFLGLSFHRVSLSDGLGPQARRENVGWDAESMKRMLLLFTAVEREMTLLSDMSAVTRFIPLSRFLLHQRIRSLRRERRTLRFYAIHGELPRRRADESRQRRPSPSESVREREAWEAQQEKREWERRVQVEDIRAIVNGPRGLWEGLDENFEEHGEEGVWEVVKEMVEYQGIALQCNVVQTDGEGNERDDGNRLDDVRHDDGDDDTAPYPPPSPSAASPPSMQVKALQVRSHRANIDFPGEMVAYIDFVASLIAFGQSCPTYADLKDKIAGFRKVVEDRGESGLEALERLGRVIGVRTEAAACYRSLHHQFNETGKEGGLKDRPRHKALRMPFERLEKVMREVRERDWGYVGTFVERYEEAGGWRVAERRKVFGLMVAEDGKEGK